MMNTEQIAFCLGSDELKHSWRFHGAGEMVLSSTNAF